MARALGTLNAAQAVAGEVRPILLCELQFVGGTVRVHSGLGDVAFGGNTYTGVGDFAGISEVTEGTDVSARGISLSLNGIPATVLPSAIEAKFRGRLSKLWIGFLTSAGALVDTPYQLFGGRMDKMSVVDESQSGSIVVQCENRLIDLKRSRVSRWTNEEQQSLHPGDRGLEYIAKLADKVIYWGQASTTTSTGGTNVTLKWRYSGK